MKKALLSLSFLSLALTGFAAEPTPVLSGGKGTESNPYLISNKEDILWLHTACGASSAANRGHYEGKYFKLTTDIDMSGVEGFYGIGGAPAGQSSGITYYFGGIFDGDGHKISNLKLMGVTFEDDGKAQTSGAKKSRDYVGFFGYLGSGAIVKNLTLASSCHIEGYNYVGGIAGANNYGAQVINCHNEGSVDAYGDYVGGIIGRINTSSLSQTTTVISGCSNTGRVRGETSYVGGIIGHVTYGKIIDCANAGSIEAESFNALKAAGKGNNAGGIAGHAENTEIQNCLNAGTIYASASECGGIIGELRGAVENNIWIKSCLNYGSVICPNSGLRGLIIGMNGSAGVSKQYLENCVFDGQLLSPVTMGVGAGGGCNTGFVSMTTSQLTSGTAIAGFSDVWTYSAGSYPMHKAGTSDAFKAAAGAYIMLPDGVAADSFVGTAPLNNKLTGLKATVSKSSWLSANATAVVATKTSEFVMDTVFLAAGNFTRPIPVCQVQIPFKGAGTEADPYQLSSADDFKTLSEMVIGKYPVRFEYKHFALTNDIDFKKDSLFNGVAVIKTTNAYKTYWFAGNLDGKNHVLSNIKTNNGSGMTYAGLFSTIGGNAVIKNLVVDSTCFIDGGQRVGGIAGWIHEGVSIINCHVAATVYGFSNSSTEVGGIVGYSCAEKTMSANTVIENCTFSGIIRAQRDYAGGIVGSNRGLIRGCVNTGFIRAYSLTGTPLTKPEYHASIGGIAGYHLGKMVNCANFGNVEGGKYVGGLGGQVSSTYLCGDIDNCLNAGVAVNPYTRTLVGAVGGGAGTGAGANIVLKDNVFDSQLTPVGAVNDTVWAGCNPMLTKDLVAGKKIELLGDDYTYTAGAYPVPASVAGIAAVKEAATIYMILPDTMTINTLEPGITADFTPSTGLTAKLASNDGFEIKGNMIEVLAVKDSVTNELTLSTALASRMYPLTNIATTTYVSVREIEAAEIVETEYFTLNGIRTTRAQRGEVLIRIQTASDGRKIVSKVMMK